MRDGVLRHGDVETIPKVIEFLTFVTTTSVFDKTLLHYSAACVGGCFSFFFPHPCVCLREMSVLFSAERCGWHVTLLCKLLFALQLGSLIAMAILQNRAALDISLYDRSLCCVATPSRVAEIIGFIKGEPNKTLAFMLRHESAVYILLFHNIVLHQHG